MLVLDRRHGRIAAEGEYRHFGPCHLSGIYHSGVASM